MVVSPDVLARAGDTERGVRRRLAASHDSPAPGAAVFGGVLMIAVAVIVLYAQGALYNLGSVPQGNANRSLGFAIVLALCGLRVVSTPGRRPVAAGIALACGLALAGFAVLAGHEETKMVVFEAFCGVIAVIGAVAALVSPEEDDSKVL